MEPRADDINEFVIRKTDYKEIIFSKLSLLKHVDIRYTKVAEKNQRR